MLASFLKAGAVHSSACTAAHTRGCQTNPLTLAELEVEVMNICESWMKGGARDCSRQCWGQTSLSKFPCAIGSAHLWHFPRLMDHLWKHMKTWYCWHTSNTNWFSYKFLTCATPCWMTLPAQLSPCHPHQPSWDHPPLLSSPGEMTTVFVECQTKWSHRLSLSQSPWNCVCSTQLEYKRTGSLSLWFIKKTKIQK